jgi:hypothetical protein
LCEIQERYGKDAVAIYGGASLTTEKSYLLGKFARVALGTRHIDYNGRLCMVSAGTAYKGALGVDRAPNPWSDIPTAEVIMLIGANIADNHPILCQRLTRNTNATLIVADPRVTKTAMLADLHLPLKPRSDLALPGAKKIEPLVGCGELLPIFEASPDRLGRNKIVKDIDAGDTARFRPRLRVGRTPPVRRSRRAGRTPAGARVFLGCSPSAPAASRSHASGTRPRRPSAAGARNRRRSG